MRVTFRVGHSHDTDLSDDQLCHKIDFTLDIVHCANHIVHSTSSNLCTMCEVDIVHFAQCSGHHTSSSVHSKYTMLTLDIWHDALCNIVQPASRREFEEFTALWVSERLQDSAVKTWTTDNVNKYKINVKNDRQNQRNNNLSYLSFRHHPLSQTLTLYA